MGIVGTRTEGTLSNVVSGKLIVRPVEIPQDGGCVAFVGAHVDGMGPGTGLASLIGVVYDAEQNLVAQGDPVEIPQGAAASWVTLRVPLPTNPVTGQAFIGFVTTGSTNVIRSGWTDDVDVDALTKTGTGGTPPATLSGTSSSDDDPSVFADVFPTWSAPDVEDMQLARLPYDAAQKTFGAGAPITGSRVTATVGWHGSGTDVEKGANAIVRTGGPLEDLVGERLKVTRRIGTLERATYVYCHDEADFPDEVADDLSLSRRAFRDLGALWHDDLVVTVEVLA